MRNKLKNKARKFGMLKFTILLVIVFSLSIVWSLSLDFNDTQYVITVTDKDRIYETNGQSKYLVFADDEEGNSLVFENTDTLLRGKMNSSNIQGQLKIGKTYKVTVVGIRNPFCSLYQNIIDVDEIEVETND